MGRRVQGEERERSWREREREKGDSEGLYRTENRKETQTEGGRGIVKKVHSDGKKGKMQRKIGKGDKAQIEKL